MKIPNILKIGLSGLVGGIIAALADVVQKGEASAIGKIEKTIETHLLEGGNIPQYTVVLFLSLLAVALALIFEAKTKIKAFVIGASILSLIMTFVPYESANSLIGKSASMVRPAVFLAQAKEELVKVNIHLVPQDEAAITEATITLASHEFKEVIARSKFTNVNFHFYQNPGRYLLTIEVPGYRIAEIMLVLFPGEIETFYLVKLEPTWVPLPVQRLLR